MAQGWKRIPLLVIFLFFSNSYGFKGGPYSNAHQQWGQPSDNTLPPRAVQSSVSEVPVTGTLLEEVGSSLFTDRPLKRLNLLQFVKGHDSSGQESTSNAQTALFASLPLSSPLSSSKKHAGSLTSIQGSSGTTITDTARVSTKGESTSFPAILGTSAQSTSDQSPPRLYISSSQDISGVKMAGAALPVFSQESISSSSSSTPGDTGDRGFASTSQGGSGPELSGSSRQSITTQAGGSYSVAQSLSTSNQYAPGSLMYRKSVLPMGISSQSPSTQSRPGSPLTSSNFFPVQEGSSSISKLSLMPQGTLGLYAPASPTKHASVPISHLTVYNQATRSSEAQFGASTGFTSQGMGSIYSGSIQPQDTTNQFAPGSPSPSVSQFLPQGTANPSSTVQSSQKQVASTFTGSSGTQSRSSMLLSLEGSTTYGGSLQPQGTTNQFAPGSPSPSVSQFLPQGAASPSATVQSSQKQVASTFTGSSGTLSGSSMPLSLQRIATYGGSLQPQGTTNRFAPGSPSPSVSQFIPQGAASPSSTVQSSQKQVASTFTGSSGTLSGSSMPLSLQRIATYGGSLQPQGTTNRFSPGSPSSYPSASLSSPQGAASQSATVQSSQKQVASTFTGSSGTLSGSSMPLSLQRIPTYGGSLQPQGTTNQFAPGSPSPSVSQFLPQGAASLSSTVQSSKKQVASTFTGSSGTLSGSSMPLSLQRIATYGGSLQPQGTTNRFSPGSPSSYPSASLSSPQGAASQSATVQSSQKQVASTFTGSSGTLSGSSMPLSLQRIATYGGSLQPQGTTNRFSPGSPSSYPSASLSSPQGAASQSATVQSSQKQVASTFTGSSGTLSGSSMPLSLQRIATYGGSLQPQGTTNRFAPGSPSSYHPPSSHQGVASSPSQALQSNVSQSLKSQRWQPSQGNLTSGVPASQGSSLSQSSRLHSRLSSLSSAGGTSSRDSGQFVSAKGGSTSYGGTSLLSQSPFNKHTPGSQAYAKFVPLPLVVSSRSTSDQHSNGLYNSDSLQTQGHLDVVEKPSSQAPPVKFQRPTGYNQAHSLGLSAQAASVSVLSEIPQTPQAPSESGSEGAQILKPSELLNYQPGVYGQGTSSASASQFLSGYGSVSNQNAPASSPSRISFSSRYQSVKGK